MTTELEYLQTHEQKAVRALVEVILDAGYAINIDNGGEEMELDRPSTDRNEIIAAMGATGDERVYIYRGDMRLKEHCPAAGWLWLVYGNGEIDEVVCDYTCNQPTELIYNAWIERIGAGESR